MRWELGFRVSSGQQTGWVCGKLFLSQESWLFESNLKQAFTHHGIIGDLSAICQRFIGDSFGIIHRIIHRTSGFERWEWIMHQHVRSVSGTSVITSYVIHHTWHQILLLLQIVLDVRLITRHYVVVHVSYDSEKQIRYSVSNCNFILRKESLES